jgi:DNA-binding beta-propeller fold protein YncE
MKRTRNTSLLSCLTIAFFLLFVVTCKKDKGIVSNGYPDDINKIVQTKCATIGCHTAKSKDGAAGLAMETWEQLFAGGRSGAACVPYSHEYSLLFLYCNTDSSAGAVNLPTMPYNKPPLSKSEMKALTAWIDNGAPSSDGKIAFADNPDRKKFYVANQGCDVVTVFDVASLLQMRYIPVGVTQGGPAESPHMIKISPDGKYWYACFSNNGSVLQKFRTSDDSYEGKAAIGMGYWNTFTISSDSKYAYAVDWESMSNNARVVPVNLTTMNALAPWAGIFDWPHGSSINPAGDTVYVTCNTGNFIYKIPVNDPGNLMNYSVDPSNPSPTDPAPVEPHDIAWLPDSSAYFVTCSKGNYVTLMSRNKDQVISTIATGDYPVEMSLSNKPSTPYLFVTCMYDTTDPGMRGSVTVINYKNLQKIKNIKTNMAEPHGIAVDDASGVVYVANRNITGPLPHHSTSCGGRIGFVSFIDLNSLNVLPLKREIATDPYSIALRK